MVAPAEPPFVSSLEDLSLLLGRSLPTLRKYIKQGMPGKNAEGMYDVAKCRAWMEAHAPQQQPVEDVDAGKLREELLREELRESRRNNDEAEGKLVFLDDVVMEFADFLQHATALLEGLPDEIAKEMPAECRVSTREIAQNVSDRVLAKLSAWEYKPNDP